MLLQPLLFPPEVKIEAGAGKNEKGSRFRGENLYFKEGELSMERRAGEGDGAKRSE